MSKEDLVAPKLDKSEWPLPARICEHFYNLGEMLRDDGIIDDYLDGKDVGNRPLQLFSPFSSNGIAHCLYALCDVAKQYITVPVVKQPERDPEPYLVILKALDHLGTTLANCLWYERYQQVASRMGTNCVISVRTAVSVFETDKQADKVKNALLSLCLAVQEVFYDVHDGFREADE